MFFELDGFTQSDLDKFSQFSGTSRFTPVLDSTMPGKVEGETEMDLEVVHAIVPDAKLVVFNIATGLDGQLGGRLHRATSPRPTSTVAQKYPGAVWSISIGSACEPLLQRDRPAAAWRTRCQQATAQGTSVFMSSGDTGGLECKGARHGRTSAPPPTQLDVGVSAISTPPSVTSVGGTSLDTDANGGWISEEAWTKFATAAGHQRRPEPATSRDRPGRQVRR